MTDYNDQPVISLDEVYNLLWVWVGRLAGVLFLIALAGYVWGKL